MLMTNMLEPARVASFLSGFMPRLATQQKNRKMPSVASCTHIVGKVSYVSAFWKIIQERALRPPEPLEAM